MVLRRKVLQGAGVCALGLGPLCRTSLAASTTAAEAYDWRSIPFGAGGFVDGFIYHPRERGLLYARTDIGGAYRFDPEAKSWVPLLDWLGKDDADFMGLLSLAVDPNASGRLYALCGLYTGPWSRDGALLVSEDRGTTWKVRELRAKVGGNEIGRGTGERVHVDPHDGRVIYVGMMKDGVLRSTDRAETFSSLSVPFKHASLVLCDPSSGGEGKPCRTVLVGSQDKPGLWRSVDGGASFALDPGAPEQIPQHAAFGPNGTLYVSFSLGKAGEATNPGNARTGGVWKRDKTGRWTEITPVKPGANDQWFGYSGLDVDPKVPGRIIVSTIERWSVGDDLFFSTDDGATWTTLGARSRHDASAYPWVKGHARGDIKMGHWIADVKLDPFDGNRAVYGTGYGLWMTQNLGASKETNGVVLWDFAVGNFEETATLEIKSPTGGASVMGAMGDVAGGAWDDVTKTPSSGLFTPTDESNVSVDYAGMTPGVLARTAKYTPTGGYWSPDGGASWRAFGPSPRIAKQANGEPTETGNIAVSANGGFFLWVPERQPAMYSRDKGKTWAVSQGWPASKEAVYHPVADRALEGVFYVHDRMTSRILTSIDGGQTFQPSYTGLPKLELWQWTNMLSAPGQAQDLWMALPDRLLHFPGPGKAPQRIKPVLEAWMVAVGKGPTPTAYHSLYVWGRVTTSKGDGEGLFRSDDVGATFTRINDDRSRFGRILSMAGDSLEYGTLYLAAHGRGVLMGRPHASIKG